LTDYEILFERHKGNPLLTARDWHHPAHTVFNPGATLLRDGSKSGIDGWVVDPTPTFPAQPDLHHEELWGVEDPRITWVEELSKYVVAYTAFSKDGPGVALALIKDFRTFERVGLVMHPEDKDAALLPCRINGSFALIHRPVSDHAANIWISFSPYLRNWVGHKPMLLARKGA